MFKVGDKVKIIKEGFENSGKYINKIGKIEDVGVTLLGIRLSNGIYIPVFSNQIKLVKEETMKLSDIKERYLVVFANGQEAVRGIVSMFSKDMEAFLPIRNGKQTRDQIFTYNFNEDLTHKEDEQWDIVEIHKPHYSNVWTRPEETKVDVTMEEIIKDYEERNKCKVNIIKGEK